MSRSSSAEKPKFGADALVDVFGHRFGHLDAQAVQVQVVLVPVLGEPLARHVAGPLAHGDDLKADHVAVGRAVRHVAEEVGDAFAVLLRAGAAG